jgi:hypothetical protein
MIFVTIIKILLMIEKMLGSRLILRLILIQNDVELTCGLVHSQADEAYVGRK